MKVCYRRIFKFFFDTVLGIFTLVLLSPVFILCTIFLAVVNHGNPFFLQSRPGKNERIFKIIKFKTMNDNKDKNGQYLPDELRLTLLGRYIRKTSLDEIPQILNVIKGDMSFVGPRPLLPEYLPLYNNEQKRRHEVKPGITGWAQVNGRNAINWQQKFQYDIWYVDNISFMLDLKILLLTIRKVFRSEGINSYNSATMEKFTGNN